MGMEPVSKPGYYAVIPADVRYDDQIPANAKLLYGEISALTSPEGFCFAGNDYFAGIYGLSERTVRSLIGSLQKAGYVQVELEKDLTTGQVVRRKIWLKVSSTDERPVEEIFPTPGKNLPQGGEENFQPTLYTDLSNTNREKENKKEKEKKKSFSAVAEFDPVPQFVDWIRVTFAGTASREEMNGLYAAFVRFLENRAAIKKPMKTQGAVTGLCNKLSKFSGGDIGQMMELLDDATVNGWQSVYARGQKAAPTKQTGGRQYECL